MAELLGCGQILDDKYLLLEKLGSGGIGSVFKAKQIELGREVAIKVVHFPLLLDDEFKRRFLLEAQTLCKLSHPNIVHVYSMGVSAEGYPYLSMELIDGKSLSQILGENGRISTLRALKIARDLASALAYVHQHGIVHRDLKPANIILSDSPEPDTVKLIDFGLARFETEKDQKLTSTGELLGTADYMSPEQCAGKRADTRSDIYSLTACLYEMLAGKAPFYADNPIGLLYKHINENTPDLQSQTIDHFHPLLNELVRKGMNKTPENRFESMEQMVKTLDNAIDICKVQSEKAPLKNKFAYAAIFLFLIGSIFMVFSVLRVKHQNPGTEKTSLNENTLAPGEASKRIKEILSLTPCDYKTQAARLHEAYLLCRDLRIDNALRQSTTLRYGGALYFANMSSQAYDVFKSLPKQRRMTNERPLDTRLAELLASRGEFKQARHILSQYVKETPIQDIDHVYVCNIDNDIENSPASRHLIERLEGFPTQLILLAPVLRKHGKNNLARLALKEAEKTSSNAEAGPEERFPLDCQWVLQYLAEGRKSEAIEKIERIKRKLAKTANSDSLHLEYEQLSTLEKLVHACFDKVFVERKQNKSLSEKVIKEGIREIEKLRSPPDPSSETIEGMIEAQLLQTKHLLEFKLPAKYECQLLNFLYTLGEPDDSIEKRRERHLLGCRAFQTARNNKDVSRETRLFSQIIFAETLANLGLHEDSLLHYYQVFADINKNGFPTAEDNFNTFDLGRLRLYQTNAAKMLITDNKKAEAIKLLKSIDLNKDPAYADIVIDNYLRLDNEEAAIQVAEECKDLRILTLSTYVCLHRNKIEAANACINRMKKLLSELDPGSPEYDLKTASLNLAETSLYLEQGSKSKAKRVLSEVLSSPVKLEKLERAAQIEYLRRYILCLTLAGMEKEAAIQWKAFNKLKPPDWG